MTSRPSIGRTRIGLLNTMFSASSSFTWAGVGLPDSRSLRKGCIVILLCCVFAVEIEQRLTLAGRQEWQSISLDLCQGQPQRNTSESTSRNYAPTPQML